MQEQWRPVTDAEGRKGMFTASASDASRVVIRLESGECVTMPRSSVVQASDSSFRVTSPFAALVDVVPGAELVIPVHAEELVVSKRGVAREQVRLTTRVEQRDEPIDVTLMNEELSVERVKIDKVVETASGPRQEGDSWILPVYEEVLVVEKRLMLREEVHVRRARREVRESQQVTLRREEVEVTRTKLGDPIASEEPAGT
jgi:uncharacterized protein (TIGR02271 family)